MEEHQSGVPPIEIAKTLRAVEAVRSRQPVVEDTVFGNQTAIACHMANASYFKKAAAVWDAGAKNIRTV